VRLSWDVITLQIASKLRFRLRADEIHAEARLRLSTQAQPNMYKHSRGGYGDSNPEPEN
jgi:hypothetical protein